MKYRVWNNATKRFLRTSTYIDSDGNLYKDNDPYGLDMSGKRSISPMPNCTIMRNTGLHDKNGKEIFEGDVIMFLDRDWVDYESDTKRLPVVYLGDSFVLRDIKENKYGELPCYPLFKDWGRDRFEIIGNIYEHPNLIKQ